MSLVRTLAAYCDHKGCWRTVDLDPQTTQPYRDMSEAGWTNQATDDQIKTYCPKHPEESR
jgi:hypothetical protein